MIPKVIHYCWFGKKKKPPLVRKCIRSWRRKLQGYDIIEWNEDNFNLDLCPFVQEAYRCHMYAFVADVARLYILYNYGGIYLDTDVEVLQNFDSFLSNTAFVGFEYDDVVGFGIMGCEKGSSWIRDNLDYYNGKHFIHEDGSMETSANVNAITALLSTKGLAKDNSYQLFPNYVCVFPKDYFCPMTFEDCKLEVTCNTVTIHHFSCSWRSSKIRWHRAVHRIIGHNAYLLLSSFKAKITAFVNTLCQR